jgi:hypothetical protein
MLHREGYHIEYVVGTAAWPRWACAEGGSPASRRACAPRGLRGSLAEVRAQGVCIADASTGRT